VSRKGVPCCLSTGCVKVSLGKESSAYNSNQFVGGLNAAIAIIYNFLEIKQFVLFRKTIVFFQNLM